MALETVKISVLAYVSYNETKERTFIAEKITSLHDIALAVRKRFGNVEIQEVHYRDDCCNMDVSSQADLERMKERNKQDLYVVIKQWLPRIFLSDGIDDANSDS